MAGSKTMRILAAVLGGIAAAGALLVLLFVVNAGEGFAHCTAATGFGWLLPVLTGLLVAAASGALLRQDRSDPPGLPADRRCEECGKPVLESWRMCPYCGSVEAHGGAPTAS